SPVKWFDIVLSRSPRFPVLGSRTGHYTSIRLCRRPGSCNLPFQRTANPVVAPGVGTSHHAVTTDGPENGGRDWRGRAGAGSQCGCEMGGGGGERGAGGRPAAAVRAAAVGLGLSCSLRRILARA